MMMNATKEQQALDAQLQRAIDRGAKLEILSGEEAADEATAALLAAHEAANDRRPAPAGCGWHVGDAIADANDQSGVITDVYDLSGVRVEVEWDDGSTEADVDPTDYRRI